MRRLSRRFHCDPLLSPVSLYLFPLLPPELSDLVLFSPDLCEYEVRGDGNCQFRSLSDQLYRSPQHHVQVRRTIVKELRAHPQHYKPYVTEYYREYCNAQAKDGTWGDNITLQAAANVFGLRIICITSFEDMFVISIEPVQARGNRILYLSFWAEVHYNSIYPATDPPTHPPDSPDLTDKATKILGSRRLGKHLSKLGLGLGSG